MPQILHGHLRDTPFNHRLRAGMTPLNRNHEQETERTHLITPDTFEKIFILLLIIAMTVTFGFDLIANTQGIMKDPKQKNV